MYKPSAADLRQMYEGSVVLYKSRMVYVDRITNDFRARVKNIRTQHFDVIDVGVDSFTPVCRRLGMMNIMGTVIYLARMPHRQYRVGYAPDTLKAHAIDGIAYPEGRGATAAAAKVVHSIEFANTLLGNYPAFETCLKSVKDFGGAMAWDRQFAVSEEQRIFYKTRFVGNVDARGRIKFASKFEHLAILLEK